MTFLDQVPKLIYQGKEFSFNGDSVFFRYDERDIISETMSSISVANCSILNCTDVTGKIDGNCGFRQLIFFSDLSELVPIVSRRTSGDIEVRNDLFAYDDNDYVCIRLNWIEYDGSIQSAFKIESSIQNINDDEIIKRIQEKFPELWPFLVVSPGMPCNLHGPVLNQAQSNKDHLERFARQYSISFQSSCGIDPYDYKDLDVIDLENVEEINMTSPEQLQTYRVVEVFSNRVEERGRGLNFDCFKACNQDRYLYLIITNCVYHRIHITNRRCVLLMKTIPMQNIRPGDGELVLIRFNERSLRRHNSRTVINALKM